MRAADAAQPVHQLGAQRDIHPGGPHVVGFCDPIGRQLRRDRGVTQLLQPILLVRLPFLRLQEVPFDQRVIRVARRIQKLDHPSWSRRRADSAGR